MTCAHAQKTVVCFDIMTALYAVLYAAYADLLI